MSNEIAVEKEWQISCLMDLHRRPRLGRQWPMSGRSPTVRSFSTTLIFHPSLQKQKTQEKTTRKNTKIQKYKKLKIQDPDVSPVCIVKVISTLSTGSDCWRFLKWNWKINTSVLKLKFNINQVFFRFSSFTRPFHSLFLATFSWPTTWGIGWESSSKKRTKKIKTKSQSYEQVLHVRTQ